MSGSRRNVLLGVLWGVCVLFALRPSAAADRVAALLLSPLRILGEWSVPLHRLRAHEARAAIEAHDRSTTDELRFSEMLWSDLQSLAAPKQTQLQDDRRIVPGEVVGRGAGDRDRCIVRVRDARGIERGMPVVSGDSYVGRVSAVDAEANSVEVTLVTAGDFFVGARIDDGESSNQRGVAWMTVGGLELARRGSNREFFLAVHNPSKRERDRGRVVASELLEDLDRFAVLAEGFELGELVRLGPGKLGVIPTLDFGAGLYHVAILTPTQVRAVETKELEFALVDPHWVPTRSLTPGHPSPWRSGLRISTGEARGVAQGAAVIRGARLVGRVCERGLWSSAVQLLDDPGLVVVVAARLDGKPDPVVLGRMVSLGRKGRAGWIELRWESQLSFDFSALPQLAPGEDKAWSGRVWADLVTGSGEPGLPGGLVLGRALLPAQAEPGSPQLVYLDAGLAGESFSDLWVRATEGEEQL